MNVEAHVNISIREKRSCWSWSLVCALMIPLMILVLSTPAWAISGDLNCDGSVGFGDINPFVLALANPGAYQASYPGCEISNGDLNGDAQVNFGDINPFVAKIAQCVSNTAPVADAGESQEGEVLENLTFDGRNSIDLNGSIAGYQWDFGDGAGASGEVVSHAYQAPGTYSVSLEVTDSCGGLDSDLITVVVIYGSGLVQACCLSNGTCLEAPPADCLAQYGTPQGDGLSCEQVTCAVAPLQAAFIVQKLEAEDSDGTLHYRTIDLEQEPLEYGVRYRFDALPSQGLFLWTFWDFGDGTFGSNVVEEHAFTTNRHVTLTVYDETWENWSEAEADVTAAQRIEHLDEFDPTGLDHEFGSLSYAVDGNDLWVLSSARSLGVGNISDPANLGAWTLVRGQGEMYHAEEIAVNSDGLFVAAGDIGLECYQKSPFIKLAPSLSLSELDGAGITGLTASGHSLYVGTGAGRLYVFDTSEILSLGGELPEIIHFELGSAIQDVVIAPPSKLAVITAQGKLFVYDVANSSSPLELAQIQAPSGIIYALAASETLLGVRTSSGTAVYWLDEIGSNPDPQVIPAGGVNFALSKNRLYLVDSSNNKIRKYDLTRRSGVWYLTELTQLWDMLPNSPFLHDPDGAGPQEAVLMVGQGARGYSSYTS